LSKVLNTTTVTGDLSVRQFEGGFTPDGFWIGDKDLSAIIAALFELELSDRGSLDNQELGKVRLTIERLGTSG
jgi:hypothetical protein